MKTKNISGLTLLEILIAVSISMIIFMAASSMIILLLNSNIRVKKMQSLEQVKNDLASDLSTSIRWGSTITSGPEILIIDGTSYKLDNGSLNRNGVAVTPSDVEITSFEVNPRSATSDIVGYDVNIGMKDRRVTSVNDTLSITVSQRKMSVQTEN